MFDHHEVRFAVRDRVGEHAIERTAATVTGVRSFDDPVAVALWCAAHGGQRAMCERLLAAGGNGAWAGFDDPVAVAATAAARSGHPELADWLAAQAR